VYRGSETIVDVSQGVSQSESGGGSPDRAESLFGRETFLELFWGPLKHCREGREDL
jgi:hypothetical protein